MKEHWLFKYKLYHIPFWMLYNYLLWALTVNSFSSAAQEIFFSAYFVKSFFYVIWPAFAVYFNLYFLIPRFLEKGRYVLYGFLLALTIIFASILIAPGYYISTWLDGGNLLRNMGITNDLQGWYNLIKGEPLKITLAVTTLAMSIKLTKKWLETQKRQLVLEKERLETELKLLKYQFNPHFLFNSMNSIFFLIHKNPNMASESLAKFSGLMRYQLYECDDPQIPLDREIIYLENFVELEKLRQDNLKVKLDLNHEQTTGRSVAPFILMTFVENAFKHVSKHTNELNWIVIKLQVTGPQLQFEISNSYEPESAPETVRYQGIGLKNAQRRLELLYPGEYQLDIDRGEAIFKVSLTLPVSETVFATQTLLA